VRSPDRSLIGKFESAVRWQALAALASVKRPAGVGPYGLGVIDQTKLANGFGVKAIGNAGLNDGGYSTELTVLPGEGIVISVMTNKGGDPKALVIPIAQVLASTLGK
jgi:CubicO group peptidase (beta-lactamase class C family)